MFKKTAALIIASCVSAAAFGETIISDTGREVIPDKKTEMANANRLSVRKMHKKNNQFAFASLTLGWTHASHLWGKSSTIRTQDGSDPSEITGETDLSPSGKAGFGAGYHWDSGWSAGIEYAWHPLDVDNFYYENGQYFTTDARVDFVFVNGMYDSHQFASHYKPHIAFGLGFADATYKVKPNGFGPVTYDNDNGFAFQVKLGFDKSTGLLNQAFSWGIDYGYVRTLQDLNLRLETSTTNWVDLGAKYSTQFLVFHFNFRF